MKMYVSSFLIKNRIEKHLMITQTEPKLHEVLGLLNTALRGMDDHAKSAQQAMISTIVLGLLSGISWLMALTIGLASMGLYRGVKVAVKGE